MLVHGEHCFRYTIESPVVFELNEIACYSMGQGDCKCDKNKVKVRLALQKVKNKTGKTAST
jgi:hypothetical protein